MSLNVLVHGCAHGQLDKIYATAADLQQPIDLVIICGDFQAIRSPQDLNCLSVPVKYREMGDFEKYYRGKARAPYLTIVIGGNHESSGYMSELHYGGWLAENIYYLGAAGVVNFRGLRIAGLSGIFKSNDYLLNHYERLPFPGHAVKSAYHVRQIDVMKLDLLSPPVDICLSHDWPTGIERCGNLNELLRVKKHLAPDISRNALGIPPAMELLKRLQPRFWFSAHHHVRYEAKFTHVATSEIELPSEVQSCTKFLALGKCHPRGGFQELLDIPVLRPTASSSDLMYDAEWLAITKTMDKYYSSSLSNAVLPSTSDIPTLVGEIETNIKWINDNVESLVIPKNFQASLPEYSGDPAKYKQWCSQQPPHIANKQTQSFCDMLAISNTF